jgi:hypothetical protein
VESIVVLKAILDSRRAGHNMEFLIHWQGYSSADATWEKGSVLKQQFPKLVLEDKARVKEGGMLWMG